MTCYSDHNPQYPNLPSVAKFRKQANPDPKAYGAAVHEAIRALQRSELLRASNSPSNPRSPCASGTWHADGKSIHKAIRDQHRRTLDAALNGPTFKRTDLELIKAYEAAMTERRKVSVATYILEMQLAA